MNIATQVREYIEKLEEGSIFKYNNLSNISDNKMAIAKILSRLTKNKKINRIEKGVFYKAKKTRFGKLKPEIEEIIKAEVKNDRKITGYISGILSYNKLGLTTQIPNVIEIVTEKRKPSKTIGGFKIKYIQGYMKFTKTNIKYLQILDALKDIKNIPDSNIENNYKILKEQIRNLENKEKLLLLSLEYTPQVRALTGAILSEISSLDLSAIEKSLNELTKFDLGIQKIKNKKRWNIK
ncbi:DUF6088 family protein [uncultured Cetobacterium sp.]|uniref:DUF6088 family protein n=1 Tax=uncultured Cetobacterium sp. TaxID=527638 RepID=UPI002637C5B6|nr:DUF6088 family protein [uncultured Cetobacterium sp.]